MRRLRAALAAHVSGLPATFWWLWTGTLLSALACFVFPFLAVFLTARGLSPARTGVIASFFGGGMLIAGPIAGWFADRVGRRPTILVALVVAGVSAAALGLATDPALIAVLVFVFGVSIQSVYPASMAVISDVVGTELRQRAMGLVYWAQNFGIGVSALVGGLLARGGWALPFLLDGATTLAFAAIVWRRVPETRPAAAARAADGDGSGYRDVFRDRAFTTLFVLHVAFNLVFWQFFTATAIDMTRRGFSPAAYGAVLAVNTALVAVLQPFASGITAQLPPRYVLAGAALLVGLGYGGYALCATAVEYALATAVWTLGEIAYMPTAGALVAELAPPDRRGRYMGAYSLGFGISGFAAPLVGPAVLQTFGAPVLWGACLAVEALVAAAFVLYPLGGVRPVALGSRVRS